MSRLKIARLRSRLGKNRLPMHRVNQASGSEFGSTGDAIHELEIEPVSSRTLAGKTVFITGASRGIGLAIALRAAQDGAKIAIAAKTTEPHPRLPGTIYTAAAAIEKAGGKALPVATNIRFEDQIESAIAKTVSKLGAIDILVNNASAIQLSSTEATAPKHFDLMHQINVRGTFLCSKYCIPYLKNASNPQVLTLAPPISLAPRWFFAHTAYTVSKYSMAMLTFGMAAEFEGSKIAFNCLWPKTIIQTAALAMIPGINPAQCRKPEIVADAAHIVLTRPSIEFTGRFYIDEEVLREEGVTDFGKYAIEPGGNLLHDLFLD
jgi:citronellol/citronellal dehydrogenase